MADEEITDLTEDGDPGAASKSKKKAKAPKAPKEEAESDSPKVKKQKGAKTPKAPGEKAGAGGVIIIMILVLLILVGGFGAALYFNVFDARVIVADVVTEPVIDVLIWLDPGYSAINQRLRAREETQERRFAERNEELDIREGSIEIQENILNTLEQQLERREIELNRREEQIIAMYERTIPMYRRDMTDQELEDMMSLSRTYTQMSPETAAEILVRLYDSRDVAAILYFMGERNSASILAAMTPEYAAAITEIWLYN